MLDAAERRLAGGDAAVGGRADQRAAGLRADRPEAHPHGHGHGRPAAGAAGRVLQFGSQGLRRGRGIEAGELDGDRLAEDDRPGPAQGGHQRGVGRGHVVLPQRRAGPGGQARHVDDVLDAHAGCRAAARGSRPAAASAASCSGGRRAPSSSTTHPGLHPVLVAGRSAPGTARPGPAGVSRPPRIAPAASEMEMRFRHHSSRLPSSRPLALGHGFGVIASGAPITAGGGTPRKPIPSDLRPSAIQNG